MLIAFIFIGVFCGVALHNNLLVKKFFGNKSDLQGIIELWSVSSFESGTQSKSSHLERVALEFEKQNKGTFVLIINLSLDECKLRLESGARPDLFSFNGDAGKLLMEYLEELEPQSNIRECLISSSTVNDNILAYPWAVGGYVLISTENRIKNAGNVIETNLCENVMNFTYDKKLKKSTKTIYSLGYGQKNGNNPKRALTQEFVSRGLNIKWNNNAVLDNNESMTSYDAYSKFVNGDNVVLLGTQRDLSRIETREKSGREDGFIVDYLSFYSDLVDYIAVVKCDDGKRLQISKDFAKFLVKENSERNLSKIGLFPTINFDECLYDENSRFYLLEKSLKQLSIVPNIFA